jgi:hypothetical protein
MNRSDIDFKTASVGQIDILDHQMVVQAPRLVVVMLDTEEEALLAGRILALARPRALPVVLVGIAPDTADAARVRRKLATIGAFLKRGAATSNGRGIKQQSSMQVEIQVEQGLDWVRGVKTLLRENDMLACYSDETIGLRQRPLADILSRSFSVPVYTFTGLHSAQPGRSGRWSQAFGWVGSVAIIAGFLAVQARIVTSAQGWVQTTLMLITLLAEVGAIWVINSMLS